MSINQPALLHCATCSKAAGFASPFPGIHCWVCSPHCGENLAESFRESKVLIGFPTSGLGFLSSQSSRASVEKDLSEHGEEGANAAVSSRLVRSVPNGPILGERLSVSAADFLKNNVKPRELGHCQSPQKDQSEEKEKENVPAHLLRTSTSPTSHHISREPAYLQWSTTSPIAGHVISWRPWVSFSQDSIFSVSGLYLQLTENLF